MKIKVQSKIVSQKGLLVVPVFKENIKKYPAICPKIVHSFILQVQKNKDFTYKKGKTISTYIGRKELPEKVFALGLGSDKKYSIRTAKEMGGKIGKAAKATNSREITVLLPKAMNEHLQELLQGILQVQYEGDQIKSKKPTDAYQLEKIEIVAEAKDKNFSEKIERAETFSSSIDYIKTLVNTPSNIVDAEYFAGEAKKIAKENKYKIVVLSEKELKKMKWGALLAVNQGSKKEAKCVVFQYDGAKDKKEKPIVIVGKGVIFDTGGYNLKPTNYIETMHQDMAGGATVMGVFSILKKLKIQKNVIGIIPLVENLISSTAFRPSDIITSFSGKTIEITNTDAEGRLILADAITYGTKFKPQAIITIATLTGAVAVATGDRYSGLMGNSKSLRESLQKAGDATDDLGWQLPIHRDYRAKLKSKLADLKNYDLGSGRYAGASKAAAFLENFVEKNKWCHIDIGGTGFAEDPKEYQGKGATAAGFEMIIKYLES